MPYRLLHKNLCAAFGLIVYFSSSACKPSTHLLLKFHSVAERTRYINTGLF